MFVSWVRSLIMVLLVARQVLTLRENRYLTQHLEQRVDERTSELAASRARFAALVQHSSDVITVVDADARIQYQSASSERLLGFQPSQIEGTSLCDLMTPELATDFLEALAHVRDGAAGCAQHAVHVAALRRGQARRRAHDHQPARRPARARAGAEQPRRDGPDRRSRPSCCTRRSTTPSPGWPTGRCSATGSSTRSRARAAPAAASRSCSWTWTTSRRSTTASGTAPATSCSCWSPTGCARSSRADTVARLRRGRVRHPARRSTGRADARRAHRGRPPSSRSSSARTGCTSRPASASRPATRPTRRRPSSCCATPTWRCTRPRRPATSGFVVYDPTMHASLVERLADGGRSPVGARERRVHRPLPAADRPEERQILGAEALVRWDAPRARAGRRRPVHPARRVDRPDPAARALGAARGLRARSRAWQRRSPSERPEDQRQRVRPSAPGRAAVRAGARHPRRDRPATVAPDARDDRERADGRHRGDPRQPARPARSSAYGWRSTTSAPATRR